MPTYTVKQRDRAEIWGQGGEYGPKQAWDLVLVKEGVEYICQANTKPDNEFPAIGEQVEGNISDQNGREIFKRAYGGGSPRRGNGAPQRSPQERDSIVRQHSQHMAILWAAVQQKRSPDLVPNFEWLKGMVDWFDRDAKGEAQP